MEQSIAQASSRVSPVSIDHLVHCYGDLLFDLCDSVLWKTQSAQLAFQTIVRELAKRRKEEYFATHERAWVLRIACERLRAIHAVSGRKLTAGEQIEIDAIASISQRLKHFDGFFHRLSPDDQILLLLRDKYGLPYQEIASAMGVPLESLKMRRQLALRTLEEWVWDAR